MINYKATEKIKKIEKFAGEVEKKVLNLNKQLNVLNVGNSYKKIILSEKCSYIISVGRI